MVAEFIEEVKIIGSLQNFNELDNMRRVDFGKNLNFIEGAFFELGIFLKFLHIDDFDCNLFFVPGIDASVNFAILSLANLFMEGVVFDYLNHSVNFIILINNWSNRQPNKLCSTHLA